MSPFLSVVSQSFDIAVADEFAIIAMRASGDNISQKRAVSSLDIRSLRRNYKRLPFPLIERSILSELFVDFENG